MITVVDEQGTDINCLYLFSRKTDGIQGKEKPESPSVSRMKREADNDAAEEVVFGKKAKLETVSSEEIK